MQRMHALRISEFQLNTHCSSVEMMECATRTLGALEMCAEELKQQWTCWKKHFNEVQQYDIDSYDDADYNARYEV